MTATAEIAGEITEPGVYDGMDEAAYHADPVPGGSLSASGAKLLLPPSCPALYRYRRDHPKVSAAFDYGTAAHKFVLDSGPDTVIVDAPDWRTRAAQDARKDARARGAVPLLISELSEIADMANAITRHPLAGALFDPDRGKPEQSLFWQDGETGIWRRARLDWLPRPQPGRRMVIPDYKGLALGTPIPTPDGWTTMRALRVGDQVFDAAGRPCAVTAKSEVHYRRCYRIRFDDKSTVVCDDEHLWETISGRSGSQYKLRTAVLTTEQIRRTLTRYGQAWHRVRMAGPLDLPDADLPVAPYVLGAWLGDGAAAAGRVSSADPELFGLICAEGYGLSEPHKQAPGRCPVRTVYGLTGHLRRAGILGHKEIPAVYLRASIPQRAALLQGLFDTDGSWNATRQQAVFTSTDKALASSVRELACSLGQRAVLHETTATGFGLTVTAYKVTFTPVSINPFRLPRKADRVQVRSTVKSRRRVITAVEELPIFPTQCIAVDSPDSTYLCTEAMIPTHNTCDKADPASIRKAVANYGYHMQAAQYTDAAVALGLDDDPAFLFVFQEKTPPYLVSIAQLDPEAEAAGRARNRRACEIWRDCTETGLWPGYEAGTEDGITYITLPPWAARTEGDLYS